MVAPLVSAPAALRPVSSVIPVTPDVARLRTVMVNLYFVGDPGRPDRPWVLVDAGLPYSADAIRKAAASLFGDRPPRCVILTHGHFDHVGSLRELAEGWDVPIYAHELELPYLTGRSSYPPPDPGVGGGLMALSSPLYPKGPYDFSNRIYALPSDGSVPGMPGWQWVATPGHSPGHVSLFREADRTLIAGDAFVTTKQESLLAVLTQRKEIHGPPMYFTPDFESAAASVRALEALKPAVAATGHGVPMRGAELRSALRTLADHFEELAVPRHGRYPGRPAVTDRRGVVSLPPPTVASQVPKLLLGMAAAFAMVGIINAVRRPFPDEVDDHFIERGV
ncbi:MAG: beta-lactamase domain protein [Phycisphaerales bacterium]|nr:beta-lactamase domain protein [Phycisphaerales bacterium]